MASVKRVLGFGCAGVLLVVVLLVGLLVGFSRSLEQTAWPEPLPGVRLEPRMPHLSDAEVTPDNGYYYLRQLTNQVDWTENVEFSACGWRNEAYPDLDAAVEHLAAPVDLMLQAARAPDFQVATVVSVDAAIPYIGSMLKLCLAICYRAERAAGQSRWVEAGELLANGFQVARGVSRGGPLINHLVSIACADRLLISTRRCAERGRPPAAWYLEMQETLNRFEQEQEPFSEAVRYEYLFSRSTIDLIYENPAEMGSMTGEELLLGPAGQRAMRSTLSLLGSTPNKTGRHFAAVYSHLVAAVEEPFQSDHRALDVETYLGGQGRARMMLNDPIGRILLAVLLPAVDKATERSVVSRQQLSATRVVLALRAREQQGRGIPDRLQELVPDDLDALPVDLFNLHGGPLSYRKEGEHWLVYSVGPNQTDDGAVYNWMNGEVRREHEDPLDLIFHADEAARICARYRKNEHPDTGAVQK